jgi:hypothetical protein
MHPFVLPDRLGGISTSWGRQARKGGRSHVAGDQCPALGADARDGEAAVSGLPIMSDAPQVRHVRNCPGYSQRRPIIPAGAVYIGRRLARYRLPESKWDNPFIEPRDGTRAEMIAKHRAWLCDQPVLMAALPNELRGRAPLPCHGVLLALANGR